MRLKVNISQVLILIIMFFVFFPYYNTTIDLYMIKINRIDIFLVMLGIIVVAADYRMKCRNIKAIVFMGIWLVYSLIQAPFCEGIRQHLIGMYYLAVSVFFAGVFVIVMNNLTIFKRIVRWMVFFIAFHNVWGWYECISHNYLYAPIDKVKYMDQTSFYKAITMFYNLNDYTMLMIAGVFLTFILYMASENTFEKNVTRIIIISEIASILYSESRGALLGFLMGAAVIIYLCMYKKIKKYLILLVPLGIIAALAVGVQLLESMGFLQDGGITSSDAVRINLIKNAFVFLDEDLGVGIGLFNFEIWMQKYAVFPTKGTLSLHNWWMEILVSSGVIIFLLYLRMYYGLAKDSYMKWKRTQNPTIKAVNLGLLGYLASFLVSSISSSNNMNKLWIWLMFALIMAFQNINLEDEKEIKIEKEL